MSAQRSHRVPGFRRGLWVSLPSSLGSPAVWPGVLPGIGRRPPTRPVRVPDTPSTGRCSGASPSPPCARRTRTRLLRAQMQHFSCSQRALRAVTGAGPLSALPCAPRTKAVAGPGPARPRTSLSGRRGEAGNINESDSLTLQAVSLRTGRAKCEFRG